MSDAVHVVDSPGWLEYFADGPNADFFAPVQEEPDGLIVPAVSVYEVFKRVLQQRSEDAALRVVAQMRQGRVVGLDTTLALDAARLSMAHRLPMADSKILATARRVEATLWTHDADFEGIEGVRYRPRPGR